MKPLWNEETGEPIGMQMDEAEWTLLYRLLQTLTVDELTAKGFSDEETQTILNWNYQY